MYFVVGTPTEKFRLILQQRLKKLIFSKFSNEGSFGKNVLAHVTLMKYDDRLPARKITCTLRNEKGVTANEVIMSLITTWKQQNKNHFLELRALL